MSEEMEDAIDMSNKQLHKSFAEKRIKEVKSGQRTFETPDHELVKPAMEEIRKGDARAFIVPVETKDGIKFAHKSVGSKSLMKMLHKDNKELMVRVEKADSFPSYERGHYIHIFKMLNVFANLHPGYKTKQVRIVLDTFDLHALHAKRVGEFDLEVTRETTDETPDYAIRKAKYILWNLDPLLGLELIQEVEQEVL